MAQITIPLKDDALKSSIEAAFVVAFGNPENVTGEELVTLHVSNFIRSILNQHIAELAKAAANTVDSLTE